MKTVGMMRQTRYRGKDRVGWMIAFTAAACNLIRIRNLTAVAASIDEMDVIAGVHLSKSNLRWLPKSERLVQFSRFGTEIPPHFFNFSAAC
jgi:hypothetical protein